jgi:hypothetical protein
MSLNVKPVTLSAVNLVIGIAIYPQQNIEKMNRQRLSTIVNKPATKKRAKQVSSQNSSVKTVPNHTANDLAFGDIQKNVNQPRL